MPFLSRPSRKGRWLPAVCAAVLAATALGAEARSQSGAEANAEAVTEAAVVKSTAVFRKHVHGCNAVATCTLRATKVGAKKRLEITDRSCQMSIQSTGVITSTSLSVETPEGKFLHAFYPPVRTQVASAHTYVTSERTRFVAAAGDTVEVVIYANALFQTAGCMVTGDMAKLQ